MLFKSEKPTALPVILDRRCVYIFPTRQGFVFILVLIAMLAGSINYNNNLGFLLVFLLGGTALVSMIHTYRNLLGLQALSVSAAPVFAGNAAVFHFFLQPGVHARKAIALSARKSKPAQTDLQSHAEKSIPVAVPTHERGILQPGSFTLSTVYPLGLFRAWTVFRLKSHCIVYPAPVDTPMVSRDEDIETDIEKSTLKPARAAGGQDFSGLKPYAPGDTVRHIAWKALSRGQGVFTKDFGSAAKQSILIFDFNQVAANDTEARLSRLCGMILQASRENLQYGLVLPGKTIPPGSGDTHRHLCLKTLAVFDQDTPHE